MQKYRADTSHTLSDGAIEWRTQWIGGPSLAMISNCSIDLAGNMRRTVYVTGGPDTWFSQPAVCRIAGCRVHGFITMNGGNYKFVPNHY